MWPMVVSTDKQRWSAEKGTNSSCASNRKSEANKSILAGEMTIRLAIFLTFCHCLNGMPTEVKDSIQFGDVVVTSAPIVEVFRSRCGLSCLGTYESCRSRNKDDVVNLEMCTSELALCYPRCYFQDFSAVKCSSEAQCKVEARARYNECRKNSPLKVLNFPCREKYRTERERCGSLFSNLVSLNDHLEESEHRTEQLNSVELLRPTTEATVLAAQGESPSETLNFLPLSGPKIPFPKASAILGTRDTEYKPCWSDCVAYYTLCIQQVRQFEDILICQRARSMCRSHPTCFRKG